MYTYIIMITLLQDRYTKKKHNIVILLLYLRTGEK